MEEDVVLAGCVSCEKSSDHVVAYRWSHLYLTDDLTREVVAYRILLPRVDLKESCKGTDKPAPIRTLSKAIDSHRADLGLKLPLLWLSREVTEGEEALTRREKPPAILKVLTNTTQTVEPRVLAIERTEGIRTHLREDEGNHQRRTEYPSCDEDEEENIEEVKADDLMPLEVGGELTREPSLLLGGLLRPVLILLRHQTVAEDGVEDPRDGEEYDEEPDDVDDDSPREAEVLSAVEHP